MTDYYERVAATHLDGSPIFATAEDTTAEHATRTKVARAFHCDVHSFGTLAPVDCYATRDGRLVGVLEIKHRSHAWSTYPSVFLNVRKWLALSLAHIGLGVPALFVVEWADRAGWIDIMDIDATRHRIGGLTRRVKARSDIEPVIEVPVEAFRELKDAA